MKTGSLSLLFVVVILSGFKQTINAQSTNWLWAKSAGGGDIDEGQSVATDAQGHVFVTGSFESSSITIGSYTLANGDPGFSTDDIFVAKYDSLGTVLWAKRFGGDNIPGDYDKGLGIVVDPLGNSYVTGFFDNGSSPITFGSFVLTGAGGRNMFVAKYDPAGNVLWAKTPAGTSATSFGQSISLDTLGNVFVTGSFQNTVAFGTTTLTCTGSEDVFTVKYDPAGTEQWAKSGSGTGGDYANGVTADASGNSMVTGYFYSPTITFGATVLTNASGGGTFFIVKYDASGNVLWAKSAGGSQGPAVTDRGNSLCSDTLGNIFVTGSFFSSSITFGVTTLNSSGGDDLFVVKYDPLGTVLWAKSATGNMGGGGQSIRTDFFGNVYVAGAYSSSTLTLGAITLLNAGGTDGFLAKYDPVGNVLWAKNVGGSNSDWAAGIALGGGGTAYVTGSSQSPVVPFGTHTVTTNGNRDFIIAKLCEMSAPAVTPGGVTTFCQGGNVTLTSSSAPSYSWSTGASTQSIVVGASGNYFVTVTNASGCSAASASVAVTVNPLPTASVIASGPTTFCQGNNVTLTSSAGSSYLWSSGASTQNITVASSGSYSVTVTGANGCSATSAVMVVTVNSSSTPSVTVNGPTTFCQGSNATLTSSSGSSYAWSTGSSAQSIVVSTAGNYSVLVTGANGCSAPSSLTNVTVYPAPSASVTSSGSTTFCQGNAVTLSAGSGNGYAWSTGSSAQSIVVSAAGTYSLIVTDVNSCSDTSATTVSVNPLPTVTLVLNPDTACIGWSGYAPAGGSPAGGTYSGLGIVGGYFYPSLAGAGSHTITYAYSDLNGCADTASAQLFVDLCAGIEDYSINSLVSIFPNPNNGIFFIKSELDIFSVQVVNILGEQVYSSGIRTFNSKTSVDLSKQMNGVYFLQVKTEKGNATKKIIIQK